MKILVYDLETAPNLAWVWGLWNQNVAISQLQAEGYMLSWAAKWVGEKKVYYMDINENTNEEMILGLYDMICEADAIVAHNGDRFDVGVMNAEFLKMGLNPPDPFKSIDTKKVAKSRFRLPSNKLDFIADYLGLGRKLQHNGFELWTGCMSGDQKSWKTMKAYNIQDVKLLEKVYLKLRPWIKNHPNHALYTEDERPVCPNCGSHHIHKKGLAYTNTMIYQRYKCKDCGTPVRGRKGILPKEKKEAVLTQVK